MKHELQSSNVSKLENFKIYCLPRKSSSSNLYNTIFVSRDKLFKIIIIEHKISINYHNLAKLLNVFLNIILLSIIINICSIINSILEVLILQVCHNKVLFYVIVMFFSCPIVIYHLQCKPQIQCIFIRFLLAFTCIPQEPSNPQ